MSAPAYDTDPANGDPLFYWQPKMVGSPVQFRLTDTALEWTNGQYGDRIPYGKIGRVRLSFQPGSLAAQRFMCELWPKFGRKVKFASTSWKSLVEQSRHDEPYADFIIELHRRIARHARDVRYEAGVPWLTWIVGVAVGLATAAALVLMVMQASGEGSWSALLVVLAILGYFGWQFGGYLVRNRPVTYQAETPPPQVLPPRAPAAESPAP